MKGTFFRGESFEDSKREGEEQRSFLAGKVRGECLRLQQLQTLRLIGVARVRLFPDLRPIPGIDVDVREVGALGAAQGDRRRPPDKRRRADQRPRRARAAAAVPGDRHDLPRGLSLQLFPLDLDLEELRIISLQLPPTTSVGSMDLGHVLFA